MLALASFLLSKENFKSTKPVTEPVQVWRGSLGNGENSLFLHYILHTKHKCCHQDNPLQVVHWK